MLSATFTAPRTQADAMLALTETHPGLSLDVGEAAEATHYTYTFFLPESLRATLDAELAQHSLNYKNIDESIDYIALSRAQFPPLTIGPFFIARNDEPTPAGLIGLSILPNRAFGSGEHATTTGCLLAYTHLISEGQSFAQGLDFGAGSGILAIAAAKQHQTPFFCIDNDPPSVAINQQNSELNGVAPLLTCQTGETPPTGQTFNLIFANILLQPLLELAEGLTAALAPGGALILSGFTEDQSDAIAAKYNTLGLKTTWQHSHGGWLAQVWQHA